MHALAAPDPQVRFALLSDWTDSDTETGPMMTPSSQAARREASRALNAAEPLAGGEPKYFLLHRRRQWDASEGRLHRLGAQARQARGTEPPAAGAWPDQLPARCRRHGAQAAPASRYVLTLDADTRLPLGALQGPGGHGCASAEPAAGIAGRAARGRRLRGAAAAHHATAAGGGRALAVPRDRHQRQRRGSLRRGGLGPAPGSVRRRAVHRQGPV